eukprot:Tbor_TRINITY_DN4470_c0_g1::TRINITY_DN4470_c0_g1_i1::g.7953::m.7953
MATSKKQAPKSNVSSNNNKTTTASAKKAPAKKATIREGTYQPDKVLDKREPISTIKHTNELIKSITSPDSAIVSNTPMEDLPKEVTPVKKCNQSAVITNENNHNKNQRQPARLSTSNSSNSNRSNFKLGGKKTNKHRPRYNGNRSGRRVIPSPKCWLCALFKPLTGRNAAGRSVRLQRKYNSSVSHVSCCGNIAYTTTSNSNKVMPFVPSKQYCQRSVVLSISKEDRYDIGNVHDKYTKSSLTQRPIPNSLSLPSNGHNPGDASTAVRVPREPSLIDIWKGNIHTSMSFHNDTLKPLSIAIPAAVLAPSHTTPLYSSNINTLYSSLSLWTTTATSPEGNHHKSAPCISNLISPITYHITKGSHQSNAPHHILPCTSAIIASPSDANTTVPSTHTVSSAHGQHCQTSRYDATLSCEIPLQPVSYSRWLRKAKSFVNSASGSGKKGKGSTMTPSSINDKFNTTDTTAPLKGTSTSVSLTTLWNYHIHLRQQQCEVLVRDREQSILRAKYCTCAGDNIVLDHCPTVDDTVLCLICAKLQTTTTSGPQLATSVGNDIIPRHAAQSDSFHFPSLTTTSIQYHPSPSYCVSGPFIYPASLHSVCDRQPSRVSTGHNGTVGSRNSIRADADDGDARRLGMLVYLESLWRGSLPAEIAVE